MNANSHISIFMRPLFGIFITLSAMVCGCNQDAFVNHLSPSGHVFDFSDDGDSTVVRFKTGEWRVAKVIKDGKEYFPGLSSEAADSHRGDKLKIDGSTIYLKKSGEKKLSIFMDPNFSKQDVKVNLIIANDFEEETITIRQNKASDYELVDIAWGNDIERFGNEIETGWGPFTFRNSGQDTLFIDKAVFGGATRTINFTGDSDFGFHSDYFSIPVPDRVLSADGSLVFSEEKAFYGFSSTHMYPYRSDKTVRMAFPPSREKSRYYKMLWEMDSYKVGYTMNIRNKASGKSLTIKGEMTSISPNGVYYLVYEDR